MEHPGASEEEVVVEEVGVGRCDAYCQPCVLSVLSPSRFAFQMTERKQADCRSIPVSQRAFCGGWSQTPGPLKAKLGDWREGTTVVNCREGL